MDLVAVSPIFNLYDTEWPIRTYQHQRPPAKTVFRDEDRKGDVLDSLVSSGCIISGARVEQSVLGPGVFVHSWAGTQRNSEAGRARCPTRTPTTHAAVSCVHAEGRALIACAMTDHERSRVRAA